MHITSVTTISCALTAASVYGTGYRCRTLEREFDEAVGSFSVGHSLVAVGIRATVSGCW